MATVHESYACSCTYPTPLIFNEDVAQSWGMDWCGHPNEDTGLCRACNGVYDERLYEMMLRKHLKGFTFETVHDWLMSWDERYQTLVRQS